MAHKDTKGEGTEYPHGIPGQMQKNWGNLCHHSLCDLICSLPMEAADGPVTEAGSQVEWGWQWSWYSITHKVRTISPNQVKETKTLQSKKKIKTRFAGSLDHSSPGVPQRKTVKKEHE